MANSSILLERVSSGKQTSVDQLDLDVARSLGIPTGGIVPNGYLTEAGPDERLRDYGLTEHSSPNYPPAPPPTYSNPTAP